MEANEKAIDNIEQIVHKERIDCDFERENAYVFTQKETEIDKLKNEQKAVDKLNKGLGKFVKTTELPMEIAGAVEFENQAKFHPLKYGYGLAECILKNKKQFKYP